jgi:hypothetical protein
MTSWLEPNLNKVLNISGLLVEILVFEFESISQMESFHSCHVMQIIARVWIPSNVFIISIPLLSGDRK